MRNLNNRLTIRRFWSVATSALALLAAIADGHTSTNDVGLTAGPAGTVLKDGKPYRAIGVNYFDPFIRLLHNPDDKTFDEGFRVLAVHKVPFARFAATGFWPRDMRLYFTNRTEYFRRLDLVVHSAEKHGVGLIPSLFWHYPCVPDLAGESMDQWGNTKSRTHELMRGYTREVVERYHRSPAIRAWEFGNEFNLACDLPNAAEHRPAVHPNLGTASVRSARDELTYDQMIVALREFGREVRKIDPHRLISSGHSTPRPSAWHNRAEKTWKLDSFEQFLEILGATHPDPIDLVSVHFYTDDFDRLENCARAAGRLKKPLFAGEFQVPGSASNAGRSELDSFLRSLERNKIPLAAIWVFDLAAQEKDFSITATNARAWQLPVLKTWNEKWSR